MDRLTVRQRQVAELVGDGLAYKQIARQLDIGEDRVATIVKRIADIVGDPDDGFEPRDTVLLFVNQCRWALAREAKLPPPRPPTRQRPSQ